MDPSDIIEDPWIFNHNLEVMKDRLKDANDHGLLDIKPWLLRCTHAQYELLVKQNHFHVAFQNYITSK